MFENDEELRFPGFDQLAVPLRSAVDGTVIRQGSLIRHALENTLVKPVDWHGTLELAMKDWISDFGSKPAALLAGISFPCPAALSSPSTGLDVVHLALQDTTSSAAGKNVPSHFPAHSVAVVGMAGIFPGGNSVDELWDVLVAGKSMATKVPERVGLEQLGGDAETLSWFGNFIEDHDTFDHKFFNKSAREALACDPQQRKLLEVVYEALESSGQLGVGMSGEEDYGCYIGAVSNNYATNVSCHAATAYATTGTARAFLSGAISHHFGWTGPAITVDTACSSSLVAIHMACKGIANGDCSRAVAGGANIITYPYDYRDLKAAGFLSATGQCRPFDSQGDGYCRGEAVGVVVLKSLRAAIEDSDDILGVIIGSGISQNGINREAGKAMSIAVPNSGGQARLLSKVLHLADVQPGDITNVEAHGTGTNVGDPIEVQGLRQVFGNQISPKSALHFSSIKGNIGHAESASGVAGVIKTLLMMRHGKIPPQASLDTLNSSITALGLDGLHIPRKVTEWKNEFGRIACVSNYGAAGSNAVLVLREFKNAIAGISTQKRRFLQQCTSWPLIICASNKDSISSYARKLLDCVHNKRDAQSQLPDILFGLAQRANHQLGYVLSLSVKDMDHFESTLSHLAQAVNGAGFQVEMVPSSTKRVILVFGGQQSRSVRLSEALYNSAAILRHHLDNCNKLLTDSGLCVTGIYPAIFQHDPIDEMYGLVTLHVTLFAIQYSCAMAWLDCGLPVKAVIGHSFGLLTALCVAGALTLGEALRLVVGRAALVKKHWDGSESGSMLSIQGAGYQEVEELLSHTGSYAEIACFNGPRNQVVVGDCKAMEEVEALVAAHPFMRSHRLDVTHGFHSKFTETLLPGLADLVDNMEWKTPNIHLEVCCRHPIQLGTPASYKALILDHTRRPVYFQHAIERLAAKFSQATWLEAGPGTSVTRLVRACLDTKSEAHTTLAPQLSAPNALDSLVSTHCKLWQDGLSVQYWLFHRSQRYMFHPSRLPPYQFQKNRHWLPFINSKSSIEPKTAPDTELSIITLLEVNAATSVSQFRVSTPSKSSRMQALIAGHVMCGHALMPASVYIEIISRAALVLASIDQPGHAASSWAPSVHNLMMRSPITLEQEPEDIKLMLTRFDSFEMSHPSWSVAIVVDGNETASGSVQLHKRRNSRSPVAQDLARFNSLIGGVPHRYELLAKDPQAEAMRGRNVIYRAFKPVVDYSAEFRGLISVTCVNSEAAAIVKTSLTGTADGTVFLDGQLPDTPMVDSFMQLGGLLANCFNNQQEGNGMSESVFVCHRIERFQVGPSFKPDAGEWVVYAQRHLADDDNLALDVYVSESTNDEMVLTALGMGFTRISHSAMVTRMKKNKKGVLDDGMKHMATQDESQMKAQTDCASLNTECSKTGGTPRLLSKRADILRIAASIADVPVEELSPGTTMDELGIDSLGATEMIGDIASACRVTIDIATFLAFHDLNAIIAHVDREMGVASPAIDQRASTTATACLTPTASEESLVAERAVKTPAITSIHEFFDGVRLNFDSIGAPMHALDYWSHIHENDNRLILSYIIDAFQVLGCDLRALHSGDAIAAVKGVLPEHGKLLLRLLQFLEEEGVAVRSDDNVLKRTKKVIDPATSHELLSNSVPKSEHSVATVHHQLLAAVGSRLAFCLTGADDVRQILFGNRENKQLLDRLYAEWPMFATASQVLGKFLCKAFTQNPDTPYTGPFRILEVGAGTGGTTRAMIDILTRHNILFEYHFTDISPTLVHKAKMVFKHVDSGNSMYFEVLDIEKEPCADQLGMYHAIISTNCIHATKNIIKSLTNLRKMMRDDGVVALIEMTVPEQSRGVGNLRPLYVFDVMVGLLEGWWLFDGEDGRNHALAEVERWQQAFKSAGFRQVVWSDGDSLEAQTVRVLCGFESEEEVAPRRKDSGVEIDDMEDVSFTIEELVYKKAGGLDIRADVYCPRRTKSDKKMPIGE